MVSFVAPQLTVIAGDMLTNCRNMGSQLFFETGLWPVQSEGYPSPLVIHRIGYDALRRAPILATDDIARVNHFTPVGYQPR